MNKNKVNEKSAEKEEIIEILNFATLKDRNIVLWQESNLSDKIAGLLDFVNEEAKTLVIVAPEKVGFKFDKNKPIYVRHEKLEFSFSGEICVNKKNLLILDIPKDLKSAS